MTIAGSYIFDNVSTDISEGKKYNRHTFWTLPDLTSNKKLLLTYMAYHLNYYVSVSITCRSASNKHRFNLYTQLSDLEDQYMPLPAKSLAEGTGLNEKTISYILHGRRDGGRYIPGLIEDGYVKRKNASKYELRHGFPHEYCLTKKSIMCLFEIYSEFE